VWPTYKVDPPSLQSRAVPVSSMPTFKFLYTLGAVTLGAVVYAQQSDGAPCIDNSDCISRLCTVPFAGPGDKQCIGRPAPDSASCSKDQEATDCDRSANLLVIVHCAHIQWLLPGRYSDL